MHGVWVRSWTGVTTSPEPWANRHTPLSAEQSWWDYTSTQWLDPNGNKTGPAFGAAPGFTLAAVMLPLR